MPPVVVKRDVATALLALAVTSEANVVPRAEALTAVATAYHQAGEPAACDAALAEAISALGRGESDPGVRAAGALIVGQAAARLDRLDYARTAFVFAAERYDQAGQPAAVGVCWTHIGASWRREGAGARAVEAYRRAASLIVSHEDFETRQIVLRTVAEAEAEWGTPDGRDKVLTEALRGVEIGHAEPNVTAEQALQLGDLCVRLASPEPARGAFGVAAQGFEQAGMPRHSIRALRGLAELEAEYGTPEQRDAALARAVAQLEDPAATANDAHGLGRLAERLESFALARDAYMLSVQRGGESEPRAAGITWHDIGDTWLAERKGPAALDAYRRAAELKRVAGDVETFVTTVIKLAGVEVEWGTREGGRDVLAEAIEHVHAVDADPGSALRLGRSAEEHRWFELARTAYERAAAGFEARGQRTAVGVTWHDIADTWAAEDDGLRALEAYRRAAEHKRAAGDSPDLAFTLAKLAEAEARWGARERCAAALREAIDHLASSGGDSEEAIGQARTIARIARESGLDDVAAAARRVAGGDDMCWCGSGRRHDKCHGVLA